MEYEMEEVKQIEQYIKEAERIDNLNVRLNNKALFSLFCD